MNSTRLTVVRERADLLDHEPAATYSLSAATDTEVRVLPQETRIFLVNTDHILNHKRSTIVFDEGSRLKRKVN